MQRKLTFKLKKFSFNCRYKFSKTGSSYIYFYYLRDNFTKKSFFLNESNILRINATILIAFHYTRYIFLFYRSGSPKCTVNLLLKLSIIFNLKSPIGNLLILRFETSTMD